MSTIQPLLFTLPGDRWVEVIEHGVIPVGTKFLVVGKHPSDGWWLICWRDGIRPVHRGTLLREEHVKDCQ